MKRTALALTLTLVLLFSVLAGTWFANLAKANPTTFFHLPDPYIISPWNATYNTNIIALEIGGPSHTSPELTPEKCWYSVDDEQRIYVDWVNGETVKRELNLTEGTHSISVGLAFSFFESSKACTDVHFRIDATAPIVTVLSLENKTYDTSDLMLNFTVNEPVTRVAYSLDGQENVTVSGNTTLTKLSYGSHNVVVYAWDTAGLGPFYRNVGASETIYFTVAFPFLTILIVALVITVAILCIVLLVYLKKRKGS